jgi:hypothetical protein
MKYLTIALILVEAFLLISIASASGQTALPDQPPPYSLAARDSKAAQLAASFIFEPQRYVRLWQDMLTGLTTSVYRGSPELAQTAKVTRMTRFRACCFVGDKVDCWWAARDLRRRHCTNKTGRSINLNAGSRVAATSGFGNRN